ncbi:MAG: hypothetical protein JXQ73_01745 [Phycisphaerae bacterium]|nr:hypothetical protein [Phycisphaerae bacterium]
MQPDSIERDVVRALRQALAATPSPDSPLPPAPPLAPMHFPVVVAGLQESVTVTPDELWEGYLPLIRVLLDAHRSRGNRIIAGLVGIPGSGKSTLAAILSELWRFVGPGLGLAVVGMDGWHLTNAELDRRALPTRDGKSIPLCRRKGSPPSFDAEELAETLDHLRRCRESIPIPVYDRRLHEPLPHAATIPGDTDIVLIEGNYLLLDEGPWADVARRIDLPLWLDIDPSACREGVIARHMAGGMPADQASAKYEENDRPNTEIVLATRHCADWLIEVDASHVVRHVRPAR